MKGMRFYSALAAMASALAVLGTAAEAKTATKKTTTSHRTHHNYFVPPPPAYMPMIVPGATAYTSYQTSEATTQPMTQTVHSRYSKYVYVREGYDAQPQPIQTNKYVTTWVKPADPT